MYSDAVCWENEGQQGEKSGQKVYNLCLPTSAQSFHSPYGSGTNCWQMCSRALDMPKEHVAVETRLLEPQSRDQNGVFSEGSVASFNMESNLSSQRVRLRLSKELSRFTVTERDLRY